MTLNRLPSSRSVELPSLSVSEPAGGGAGEGREYGREGTPARGLLPPAKGWDSSRTSDDEAAREDIGSGAAASRVVGRGIRRGEEEEGGRLGVVDVVRAREGWAGGGSKQVAARTAVEQAVAFLPL